MSKKLPLSTAGPHIMESGLDKQSSIINIVNIAQFGAAGSVAAIS